MKTLVIDAFKLVKGVGKSIGIYNLTMNLVQRLAQENVRRGYENRIIVLGNEYNREDMSADGVTFELMKGDPKDRKTILLWELFTVTKAAKQYGADRILFPRGFRPLFYGGKDTIIIHDLIPFYYAEHYPDYFNRLENTYIMMRLKASIKGADRIITISDSSVKDILDKVPGSAGRVVEIYNGLNEMKDREAILRDAVRDDPYIVAVTSSLPHKNAAGIMRTYESYHALCAKEKVQPLPLKVIGIASADDFVKQGLISEEAASRITCYSYIEKYRDMCSLIASAQMFLFLSVAEGFGFPPLEAMQLKVPVICSDRTSLPEVVGDAGILVDPDDPSETAGQLLRLQSDEDLRQSLVRKGDANIERFGWDSRIQAYWEELFR